MKVRLRLLLKSGYDRLPKLYLTLFMKFIYPKKRFVIYDLNFILAVEGPTLVSRRAYSLSDGKLSQLPIDTVNAMGTVAPMPNTKL